MDGLTSIGWRVQDDGDLDFKSLEKIETDDNNTNHVESPNAKNSLIVGKGCEMVARSVANAINEHKFPLILGGDHSIGAGSLAGLLSVRPNMGVIWVDAHADINTPELR